MRGSRPSWIAWRASEKAPVITAWLAMTVATVDKMTSGSSAHCGAIRKNGFSTAAGLDRTSAPWPR